MEKGIGYAWGMSSVILSVCFLILPVLFPNSGSWLISEIIVRCIQFLWLLFPVIGFILAFIGKVRSEYGTKARQLCNVGAGIGWSVSVIYIFSGFGSLWIDVFSISAREAELTVFVDTILIAGYLLITYIKGKLLWFI